MRAAILMLVAAACAGAACGKKGPPLAPYVHVPAAVTEITAERLGDDVFVTLTPPDGAHDGAASTGQLAKLLLHFDDRAATPAVLFTEVYAHALVAMEDGGVLG